MNKGIKFFLITGCIVFLIGIGLVTTGFIMGGAAGVGSYLERSGLPVIVKNEVIYEKKLITPPEANPEHTVAVLPADGVTYTGIRKLEVEAGLGRIELVNVSAEELAEGSIRVFGDGNGNRYRITQDRDTLEISLPRPIKRNDEMEAMVLYVAEDMVFREIEIESNAGAFYADTIQTESLSLEANAGTIDIKGGSVKYLEIDCNAGEVICQAKTNQNVEVDCAAGSVELSLAGTKNQYNYELECTTGLIKLEAPDREEYSGLRRKEQINNQASAMVELDCKAGNITVHYPEASV